jgi:hypothetical protein
MSTWKGTTGNAFGLDEATIKITGTPSSNQMDIYLVGEENPTYQRTPRAVQMGIYTAYNGIIDDEINVLAFNVEWEDGAPKRIFIVHPNGDIVVIELEKEE